MNKQEAKLKLITILSNKNMSTHYSILTHKKDINLNGQTLFSTSCRRNIYRVSINEDLKATYEFHKDLREILGALDVEDIYETVKYVDGLEEVN